MQLDHTQFPIPVIYAPGGRAAEKMEGYKDIVGSDQEHPILSKYMDGWLGWNAHRALSKREYAAARMEISEYYGIPEHILDYSDFMENETLIPELIEAVQKYNPKALEKMQFKKQRYAAAESIIPTNLCKHITDMSQVMGWVYEEQQEARDKALGIVKEEPVNSGKAKFIMLTGLPGSGKSYFAEKYKEEHDDRDVVTLSSDDIREELYGDPNMQKAPWKVFELMDKRAEEALSEGKDVIYDATGLTKELRQKAIMKFMYGPGWEERTDREAVSVFINTPIRECLKRNEDRERRVPENVIFKMAERMSVPDKSEGFAECLVYDGFGHEKPFDKGEYGTNEDRLFSDMTKNLFHDPDFKKSDLAKGIIAAAIPDTDNGNKCYVKSLSERTNGSVFDHKGFEMIGDLYLAMKRGEITEEKTDGMNFYKAPISGKCGVQSIENVPDDTEIWLFKDGHGNTLSAGFASKEYADVNESSFLVSMRDPKKPFLVTMFPGPVTPAYELDGKSINGIETHDAMKVTVQEAKELGVQFLKIMDESTLMHCRESYEKEFPPCVFDEMDKIENAENSSLSTKERDTIAIDSGEIAD